MTGLLVLPILTGGWLRTVESISVYSFKQAKLGSFPKSLSDLQSVHQLTDLHTQSHILIIWGEGSFEKICSLCVVHHATLSKSEAYFLVIVLLLNTFNCYTLGEL
jgi:hypothetical protein